MSESDVLKTYLVGGAVRDRLLGMEVKDKDYVVVGATPEQMINLGFAPVGKDFPVFLHPKTKEECALARTERKNAKGHKGFEFFASPTVTLEEDLARRDFTINAIAEDADGNLIDPFNGQADLKKKILRHIGPAFSEDPLRVLRACRFAARLNFTIAEDTLALMRTISLTDELRHLSAERIWSELSRGLSEAYPSIMLAYLDKVSALRSIAPPLDGIVSQASSAVILNSINAISAGPHAIEQRFSLMSMLTDAKALTSILEGGGQTEFSEANFEKLVDAVNATKSSRDIAKQTLKLLSLFSDLEGLSAEEYLQALINVDGIRRPERFEVIANTIETLGREANKPEFVEATNTLQRILRGLVEQNLSKVIKQTQPEDIANIVHRNRLDLVRSLLNE